MPDESPNSAPYLSPETLFRARDFEALGLPRGRLQRMLGRGQVERVSRGVYRFAEGELTENFTVAAVCSRVPNGVVCLLSALQLHQIGTQFPHEVWIAIDSKARKPRLDVLPVRIVRFSGAMLQVGVETHEFHGVWVRVTSPARTVVDCFRYRNKIGLDVALEALRESLRDRKATVSEIAATAVACRVRSVIRPYLESMSA
jgi:predicted transcriptional regulator of viral defense system